MIWLFAPGQVVTVKCSVVAMATLVLNLAKACDYTSLCLANFLFNEMEVINLNILNIKAEHALSTQLLV